MEGQELNNNPENARELDYWYLYLYNYLRDHHFTQEELDSEIVASKADSAAECFSNARRNGYDYFGAKELSMQQLFCGIGDSVYEILADILEEDFSNDLDLSDAKWYDFWIRTLVENIPDLFEGVEETDLGYVAESVESHRYELIGRIAIYLNSNGL